MVRYTSGVLSWGKGDLAKMDVKTRKTMTMHGAFHINLDRLYMKRKDGRGLISVTDCVRMEEENLLMYVTKSEEWMLQKVLQHKVVTGSETRVVVPQVDVLEAEVPAAAEPVIPTYKARVIKERTDRFMKKRLHGRFFKDVGEDEVEGKPIAGPRSFEWVKAGCLFIISL